jgi:hypothetical protein
MNTTSCCTRHPTTPVLVWIDVDEQIAALVDLLQQLPGCRTLFSCQGGGDRHSQAYVRFIAASEQEEETFALCRKLRDILAPVRQEARRKGTKFNCEIDLHMHAFGNVTADLRITSVEPHREAAIALVTQAIAASLAQPKRRRRGTAGACNVGARSASNHRASR